MFSYIKTKNIMKRNKEIYIETLSTLSTKQLKELRNAGQTLNDKSQRRKY